MVGGWIPAITESLPRPPLPLVVARGADPERHPVVAGPLAEPDVQVQVVADGVEDVGGEGGGHLVGSAIGVPHSGQTANDSMLARS